MRTNKNKQGAFTLIEMLVVISIIGLLASIILVGLDSARQQSRVGKRIADMRQIQTAVELYYHDYNAYPESANDGASPNTQCTESGWGGETANNVIPGLVPKYIASMPADPSMNTTTAVNCYVYISDGEDYKIDDYHVSDMSTAQVLSTNMQDPGRTVYSTNPCDPDTTDLTPPSMALYTPDATCW